MTTGEKIKQIRLGKGWTQTELGKRCGMADSQIGAYERGESTPREATIARIAEALDVDPAALNQKGATP